MSAGQIGVMARRQSFATLSQKWMKSGLCVAIVAMQPWVSDANASSLPLDATTQDVNEFAEGAECGGGVPDRASLSRERLVLNGAPSALERIRMSQRTETAADSAQPASTTQSILMRSLANRPVANAMAPASRTSLNLGEVRAQSTDLQCEQERAQGFSHAFRVDRPNLRDAMGTRPIPVRRTAFDDRWQRVRAAPPASLMQHQLQQAGVSQGMADDEVLRRVNRHVNQTIAYRADTTTYGQRDYWASAAETIANKAGDCEDYAILKMHMLRAAGVSASKMRLMLLRDLAGNADHAFLVVSSAAGDQVLDNNIDRVYAAHEAVDVRPVLSFSEDRRWVHAIRDQDLASNIVPARHSVN